MSKNPRILVIEDNLLVCESLRDTLTEEGYAVDTAQDAATAEGTLTETSYDIILLDMVLPDKHGKELLEKWQQEDNFPPVIVLTAHADVESAVECMKADAYDFLTKPVQNPLLLQRIKHALERQQLTTRMQALQELTQRETAPEQGSEPVYQSEAMKELMATAEQIAQHDVSCILLRGESGSGKGLLARILHQMGPRRENPFVEVNCSALPSTLVESELFGHKKGAFTDAKEDRMGVFQMADGGTLFLDEIGDMDQTLQIKLLKVIEEQKFRPIGGSEDIDVDVTIIAATNQDIEKLSENGEFRRDLYYRLNVFPVRIPPLRERTEDIPLLAQHFLKEFSGKFNKSLKSFSDDAITKLTEYHWPGNIRELRNVVERCCLLAKGPEITARELSLPEQSGISEPAGPKETEQQPEERPVSVDEDGENFPAMPLDQAEALAIKAAMKQADQNKNEAARILGIHRTTLYKKLEDYGMAQDTQ